ncbi:hypothetical protein PLICRDRAFT_32638 [Plicaturopsis crispa FD-325 SS-3]|uniref:Class II aldolase/adducin N-terminal domain-containing protein n=1 Tax=Plicaturopsis crispa FD-325 SS-3 TaxID=944288 RepID=A0A0C9SQM1_PLICR|nr:hypothetical protein PLICRDRAFT_32638 [Plicaturopsis crispa FD-325 SS-3]
MAPIATETTAAATRTEHNDDLEYTKQLEYVDENTRSAFPKHPKFPSKLEERAFLKFRLAQACRIFGHFQYDEGVAGHITVRDPIKPDCFWVNPFGAHFSTIHADDLMLVDHYGRVQKESAPGKLLNYAGFMIHSAVHRARPDVHAIAHAHTIHGKAFGAFGKKLEPYNQDVCAFYNDHGVYGQFKGIVTEEEEVQQIAQALGNNKALIMQNHGLLVATPTIEASVFYFGCLERSCKVQLMIEAAAAGNGQRPIPIAPDDAYETYKTMGDINGGWFTGLPEFQALEAREGVRYNFKTYKPERFERDLEGF